MAVRGKHSMRYVRTYIFVIDTDPRAQQIDRKHIASRNYLLGVREPVKYFVIFCRSRSESDCTRPD
ncbi:hypothetical protein P692DRAFT_20839471, partial [Suillus brevipes Sb2]